MVMSLLTRPKVSVATVIIATDGSGNFNTDGTDDDVQIQAAIDSLPAGGGCIYIKEGIYNISTTITIITNNVALIGCGRSTQIQTIANIIMLDARNVSGILIDSIYWYGAGAGINNTAIRFFGTTTLSFIKNCWVENCHGAGNGGAIVIQSNDNEVTDCYVTDNFDTGIYFSLSRVRIINNFIIDNSNNGIECEGDNAFILGNYCEGNLYGIYSRGNYGVISGNICLVNNSSGIGLIGSIFISLYGNIIDGNVSNTNVADGITLLYCNNSIISDNVCIGNDSGNTVAYDGIGLSICDNNIISNNRCQDNDGYEINIFNATCDKNLVEGNICIGADHQGTINDGGTNTQIFNNVES